MGNGREEMGNRLGHKGFLFNLWSGPSYTFSQKNWGTIEARSVVGKSLCLIHPIQARFSVLFLKKE